MGPCQLRRELPYWYCVEMCCFLLKMIIFTSLNTYLHELRMQCSVSHKVHTMLQKVRIAKLPTSPNMQYLHCLVYQLSVLNRTLRGPLRTKSLFSRPSRRLVPTEVTFNRLVCISEFHCTPAPLLYSSVWLWPISGW